MEMIEKDILFVLYRDFDAIKASKGIYQDGVFQRLNNSRYKIDELRDTFHTLITQEYIEEFYTFALRNNIIMPRPLYNRAAPNAEQHLKYILTDLGRQVYVDSLQQKIFIIHGHNEAKWRELKSLLSEQFGHVPIILSEQPSQSNTIIEKFEHYASQCKYAFAIFTPDDIVSNNGREYFQARPNVIFELGWFTARLGRKNVCILYQDRENSSIFSDFDGIVQLRFYHQIVEKYLDIKKELHQAGIITTK